MYIDAFQRGCNNMYQTSKSISIWAELEESKLMPATNRFCDMWREWKRTIPDSLAFEDPSILCEFLSLAGRETGICRSELERGLQLKQPRVSKLAKKLLDSKWLEVVPRPLADGRLEFIRATPLAKSAMRNLETSLATLSAQARSLRSSPRKLRPPANRIGNIF